MSGSVGRSSSLEYASTSSSYAIGAMKFEPTTPRLERRIWKAQLLISGISQVLQIATIRIKSLSMEREGIETMKDSGETDRTMGSKRESITTILQSGSTDLNIENMNAI